MSEPYRLWAIETASEKTAAILSFAAADARVILAPSINKYKEIKLRLLNATHSLCCGVAYLSGFLTVREALNDNQFRSYMSEMLLGEIVPLVADGDISFEEARSFAMQVIDRFSNQSIEHLWVNIAVQYTAKMQMRVVPLVDKYVKQHGKAPTLISFGFAAYLLFMKSKNDADAIGACASKTTMLASEIFNKLAASGVNIDMVVVDYADILMPTGNFKEKRHALGNIYEDLRGLAGELEIPIWTASQANRSALEEDVIGADKVAEDYTLRGTFTNEEKGINNTTTITLDIFNDKKTAKSFVGKKVGDVVELQTKGLFDDDHKLMDYLKVGHDDVHGLDISINFGIKSTEPLPSKN